MKHLFRRLSRVADSSQYDLLRSDSNHRSESFLRSLGAHRAKKPTSSVPKGHFSVYVGDEKEMFVVGIELLNHPVIIGLLNRSAEEYGYEQKGGLRIPCHVMVFERIMESFRLGVPVSIDIIGDETI